MNKLQDQIDKRKAKYVFLIIEPKDEKNIYFNTWSHQLPQFKKLSQEKIGETTLIQGRLIN